MKELITVKEEKGKKFVSARDLYTFLGLSEKHFSRWANQNIEQNPFAAEHVDYERFSIHGDTPNGGKKRIRDFAVCLDFAKKLCMVSNSPKGDEVRKYFIECEKAVNAIKEVASAPKPEHAMLEAHTKRVVQVTNSKAANSRNFKELGKEKAIEYHRIHCKLVSGWSPSEIIRLAKERGLKSKQRESAKEVFRNLRPDIAIQMSVNDELYTHGMPIEEACRLTAPSLALFAKLHEMKQLNASSR